MSRIARSIRRERFSRRWLALLVAGLSIALAGVAIAGPDGEFVVGGGTGQTNGLTRFGPVNPDYGFPDWYQDVNGVELEGCFDARDPNCAAPPVPNPDAAPSFPDNWPDEFFYTLADANMTANGGNAVLAEFGLEGAFAAGPVVNGDQMVFARIRYRVRGGVQPGATYTITHPYGTDKVVAGDTATIFVTQDIGAVAGAFGAARASRLGPFLKWDPAVPPAAPAGYVGDGATPHKVVGSRINDQNYVKMEGPGIGGANNPNPCPGLTATTSRDCIYTDLFMVVGKLSTRGGVQVARASYTRDAAGKVQLDVMAESKLNQNIVVRDTLTGANRRFSATPLVGENGRYMAHLDATTLPDEIEVVNRGDVPQTVKRVRVTDQVIGTAEFDATGLDPNATPPVKGSLTVTGASSDAFAPVPTLFVEDLAPAPIDIAGGSIPLVAAPDKVKVSSSAGGTALIPVKVVGAGMPALALAANAGADQTVDQGVAVQLDGSASTGNIDAYQWTQTGGPAQVQWVRDNTAIGLLDAPTTEGTYTFQLTVSDNVSAPPATSSDTVVVTVRPPRPALAKIALDGTVLDPAIPAPVAQNLPIALDGSQSEGAASFSWRVVSTPVVTPPATTAPTLGFTVPKTTTDVLVSLTVRNPGVTNCPTVPDGSCDTATVTLRPIADTLTIVRASLRQDIMRWRVDGSATSTTQNSVVAYSGPAADPAKRIGSSPVLADGTWQIDVRGSTVQPQACPGLGGRACVTLESDRGGTLTQVLDNAADIVLPPAPVTGGPAAGVPGLAAATAAAADVAALAAATAPAVLAAPAVTLAPGAITPAAVAATGIGITVAVPRAARIVRLQVLAPGGRGRGRGARAARLPGERILLSTVRNVKGGTTVHLRIRSKALQRTLRPGGRYVIEVRAGTSRTKLGRATRKAFRVRA
jgi:hypothetical protein